MDNLIEKKWQVLLNSIQSDLNSDISLKGVLFLIGVQELNKGVASFSKEEKIAVLHVAVCSLLAPQGFYAFDRIDEDGWPHWKELKPVTALKEVDQELLIKKAILSYFNKPL